MSLKIFIISSYAALLKLYPTGFQHEYAEEMNTVFIDLVESTDKGNRWKAVRCFLNECLCLPGCLIREYYDAIGGRKMKTTKQNLVITSIGFMSLFLILSIVNGYYRSQPAGNWTHTTTTLFLVIDFILQGILYGVLGGIAISIVLPSTNRKQMMLACGIGYLISSFITGEGYWEVLGISTKWINQNWESFLVYASSPMNGFLIGLIVGWVWKGWKAGLIFSIASTIIFTLGFWTNYLSWYVLTNVFRDNILFGRSWLMVNWIVGYLLFGGVVGILWGILMDRIQRFPLFSSNVIN